ncbi:DUF4843 domain-containing protein [Sphingobacterium pedocola]|nr:DUF4843 domain-containing protein [Sphingobacterium pedocola]
MKRLHYIFFSLIVLLTGCEKNEPIVFKKEDAALQLWFGTTNQVLDSVSFNFSYMTSDTDSVVFNARILGKPLDHDIEFELSPEGDADLVYFALPKFIIKAGEVEVKYPIYFEKPDNYQEFKTAEGVILFKLKPSPMFKEGNKEMSALKISLKNSLAKPDNWDSALFPYSSLNTYFGAYSNRKFEFMIETLGVSYFNVFLSTNAAQNTDPKAISSIFANYYASICRTTLAEYNATHTNPMIDEDTQIPVTF